MGVYPCVRLTRIQCLETSIAPGLSRIELAEGSLIARWPCGIDRAEFAFQLFHMVIMIHA